MRTYTSESTLEEIRIHCREKSSIGIVFTVEGLKYRGLIHNIGIGGVFVETSDFFPLGQEIVLVLPSPSKKDNFEVTGEIAWTNSQGFGVRFQK